MRLFLGSISRPALALFYMVATVAGTAVRSHADEQTALNPPPKSPLAALPGAPGPHIEKIKALDDNAWLNLGAPAPDPTWGKARGRCWGPHMPYAPERRAAFLNGEGIHGYTMPNGHYTDDFWAYDVNANRWICLYPGSDTKNIALKMDANGFETDASGQPIPVAQLGHAFEQVTYDTDRQRYMFVPCAVGHHLSALGARRKAWGSYPYPFMPVNCSPWMYNPSTGKFELYKTQGPYPGGHTEAVVAAYVPSLKKLFHWRRGQEVWFYDIATNSWSKFTPKGPKVPFGNDPSACLDLKRDRLYMGGGYYPFVPKGSNALWWFDFKSNEWVDLQPKGQPCKGCNRYGPNHAVMNYDSVNDVVVLFYHLLPTAETDGPRPEPNALGIYIYDPKSNSWSENPLPFPAEIAAANAKGGLCYNSFYSAELNAHFIYMAGDSADNGIMWVYRYKQAAGK